MRKSGSKSSRKAGNGDAMSDLMALLTEAPPEGEAASTPVGTPAPVTRAPSHANRTVRRERVAAPAEGLAITDSEGRLVHSASPVVVEHLGYAVERLRLRNDGCIPAVLGVTSTLRGEGASDITCALAAILTTESEATVCLVELDWWTVHQGESHGPGLAQALSGAATLEEICRPTNHPRLHYVPPGEAPEDQLPTLVRSAALRDVFEELRQSFSHVILGVPPVLVTSEALAIAAYSDACLMVARQGATHLDDLDRAIDSLGRVPVLGVVLTDASSKVPSFLTRMVAG